MAKTGAGRGSRTPISTLARSHNSRYTIPAASSGILTKEDPRRTSAELRQGKPCLDHESANKVSIFYILHSKFSIAPAQKQKLEYRGHFRNRGQNPSRKTIFETGSNSWVGWRSDLPCAAGWRAALSPTLLGYREPRRILPR